MFTKLSSFLIKDPTNLLFLCFFGEFLLENSILFCAGHKLIPEPFLSFLARHVGSALSGYWILPCQATLAIQPVEGTNERRRDSTWMSILNSGLLFISELLNQPFVCFVFDLYLCKIGGCNGSCMERWKVQKFGPFLYLFLFYIYICCPPPPPVPPALPLT